MSTDFQRNILEFETMQVPGADGAVQQVEWCGNDAIILTWPDLVLLVGPSGETIPSVKSARSLICL